MKNILKTVAVAALVALGSEVRAAGGDEGPVVLGRGVGLFEVGGVLESDDFKDLDDWVVQLEDKGDAGKAKVEAREGKLDCFVPGVGCTVWFKKKLKTRTAITYEVVCPAPASESRDLAPSDLNQFWMATDPADAGRGLFDAERYDGGFGSYDKMHGYYASTGGGRNTTTRFRRYPRQVDGKPADHLALTGRDGQEEFMIAPDKVMKVQLVAYDDVIQYIVDGKLIYEVAPGEEVQVESRDGKGAKVSKPAGYDEEAFPSYREGFFGFRMVRTHHLYSNFRVHELKPARTKVEVDSIEELRAAGSKSNQHVVMKPGTYVLEDLIGGRVGFEFTGSNNHFDLSGVTLVTPLRVFQGRDVNRRRSRGGLGTIEIRGDKVSFVGATFENTYAQPLDPVIDFGSYNQNPDNYPSRGVTEMRLRGDDIRVEDCRFTVRGSYPYGYGNMYGIGDDPAVPLRKHCGILITGDRVILDGCYVKMEAFGHAIFVQGGDEIIVRNTEVEGEVRPSNDFLEENDDGDLAKRFGHRIQWPENVKGLPVCGDHMINLTEDGIRAYAGTGKMTVENCKVTKCRGGIKLYMAKSATITDCEVRDCVIQGFSIPSRGEIIRCKGNAAYGPLLYVHMDSHSSQKIDLEVLPAPHAMGDHPLAAIKGQGHHIRLSSKGAVDLQRPVIIGYPMRFDYLTAEFPKVPESYEENFKRFAPDRYRATDIRLENRTAIPVVLGEQAEGNEVISDGKVRDLGRRNRHVGLVSEKD